MRKAAAAIALVGTLGAYGSAWADRPLLEAPGASVTLVGSHACAEPATIAVSADDPYLFEGDSAPLQSLVDAARAMLGFECPQLREIEVQGRLRGLGTNVYRGVASREGQWRLDTLESIRSQDTGMVPVVPPEPEPPQGFSVAGLGLGMSEAEAAHAIRGSFGRDPQYHESQRRMTFYDGGCPIGYDASLGAAKAQAGWVCLEADFGAAGMAGLQRLDLIQVVGGSDADSVISAFEGKFGAPAERWTQSESTGGLFGDSRAVEHLTWGQPLAAAGSTGTTHEPRELHAQIHVEKGGVVTRVLLESPEAPATQSGTGLKL